MTTAREHFDWARTRALEYVEAGRAELALSSLTSDLGKHPGTAGIMASLFPLALAETTAAGMRRFIEGLPPPPEPAPEADTATEGA